MKLSDLKGPPFPVRLLPVADCMLTQRVGGVCEEQQEEEVASFVVRKRNRKPISAADGGGVRVRGHRQRDFDPAAEEEEEEVGVAVAEPQENREKGVPASWTQNQQKLLELALQQFPKGTAERWDRIAKVVPGKTKVSYEKGGLTTCRLVRLTPKMLLSLTHVPLVGEGFLIID